MKRTDPSGIDTDTFEARLQEAVKRDDLSPAEADRLMSMRVRSELYGRQLAARLDTMRELGIDLIGRAYDTPIPLKYATKKGHKRA